MDVRAFGSVYGQSATLPYASGCLISASGTSTNFPSCRGFYVVDGGDNNNLQVIFSDSPGRSVTLTKIKAGQVLPFSITTVSGAATTVGSVLLLY